MKNCRNCEGGGHPNWCGCPGYPPGARVLIDGEVEAIVRDWWPEGSSSYFFPHYTLRVVNGGPLDSAVHVSRVGIKRRDEDNDQ